MVILMKGLQIATYNIRLDTEEDGNWSWENRKKHVIQLIKYHEWDIFGVQEARPHQVEDFEVLEGYASFSKEREGDNQGEGLGIYYKKNLFDCLEHGYFWLSETPEVPSIHPEAGCKRIALWGVLKDKQSQQEILIINTHLDHISETARQEGMAVLLEIMSEKISEYKTIIFGDFNADRKESFHQELASHFIYPRDKKEMINYGPIGTFQEFNYNASWEELEEIDFILFRGLTVKKYGVLTDSCNRKFPSDHFPVVATFTL